MSNKKFKKRIAKAAIVATTLSTIATPAFAVDNDIYNGATNLGNIQNIILHNKPALFDMIKHTSSYNYEIGNKLYSVADVNKVFVANPDSDVATVAGKVVTDPTIVSTGLTAEGQAAVDKAAADPVIAVIAALPTTVATTDEAAIVAARASYTALTAAQQALVTNLPVLVTAETALAAVKTAAAAVTAAETAVAAYEAAPIVTLADITAAEALETAANTSIAAVADKTAFETRVAAKKQLVEKAKIPVVTTVTTANVSVVETKLVTPVVVVNDQFGRAMTSGFTLSYAKTAGTSAIDAATGAITGAAFSATPADNANTYTVTATPTTGDAKTTTFTATVTADTVRPTISTVTVIDKNTIDVKFSEKVASAGANDRTSYEVTRLSTQAHEDPASAVLQPDGQTVRLTLTTALVNSPGGYSLTIDQAGTDIADLTGNAVNTGDEVIFTGLAGDDTEAPVLMSATYNSGTRALKLTFNEPISDATYAPTNITFAGRTLTALDTLGGAANDNVADITLSAASAAALDLTAPSVTLTAVDGASLADPAGNEVSATHAVTLVTPPVLADATGSSFDETTRVLTVAFKEPVTLVDVTQISLAGTALAATDKVIASTDGTSVLKIQLTNADYLANFTGIVDAPTLDVAAGAVKDSEDTLNLVLPQIAITTAQDTVAPKVTGVTYNNLTHVLTFTMSEAVTALNAGQWSIDANPTVGAVNLTAATAAGGIAPAISADGMTVTATLNAGTQTTVGNWFAAGKAVNLYTTANTAVTDLAGNNVGTIALADGSGIVYQDKIAPNFTNIATISATKFALTFSEKLDAASANTAANYSVFDNQNHVTIPAAKAELQADGLTVYVTLAQPLTVPIISNYTASVVNVCDFSLNRISNIAANNSQVFTLGTVDTTAPVAQAPVFTSVANGNNDTVAVTFTEAGSGLDQASAENLANYTLKAANNSVISLAGAKAVLAGNTVTITLANGVNLQTGVNYKLDVANVKDKAENVMTAYAGAATAAVGDVTAPTITSVEGITGVTTDKVVVHFSESVQKSLAENIANYTVHTGAGYATALADLDAKSVVYTETASVPGGAIDTFTATITYDAGTLDTSARVTTEAGLKDLAGNAMVAAANVNNPVITDGVAPAITSVTATTIAGKSNDTIAILFNEPIAPTSAVVNASDLINVTVKDANGNNLDLSNATAAMSNGNQTLTITLAGATTQLTTGSKYTVYVDGVMDPSGNVTTANKSDVAEGDVTAPTFTVTTGTGADSQVTITLSEDCNAATITKGDFAVETSADGSFDDTVTYIISSIVNNPNRTVNINLTTPIPAADGSAAVRVKLTKTANGITDLAGNTTVSTDAAPVDSGAFTIQ